MIYSLQGLRRMTQFVKSLSAAGAINKPLMGGHLIISAAQSFLIVWGKTNKFHEHKHIIAIMCATIYEP